MKVNKIHTVDFDLSHFQVRNSNDFLNFEEEMEQKLPISGPGICVVK